MLRKLSILASLTADEIKSLIIKNNNNTFDYWAALALHVDNVWDKLDTVTQRKYKEAFSIVAHHALKHQNVVNSIFKSIIEHKDAKKENKFDKFTDDELEAELKKRRNSSNELKINTCFGFVANLVYSKVGTDCEISTNCNSCYFK